jgi:hypothetical protein
MIETIWNNCSYAKKLIRNVQRKGPKVDVTPTEVRYTPIVVPLLPRGARSCVIAIAVGAYAARTRA